MEVQSLTEDVGLNLPNCQRNLVIVLRALSVLFWHFINTAEPQLNFQSEGLKLTTPQPGMQHCSFFATTAKGLVHKDQCRLGPKWWPGFEPYAAIWHVWRSKKCTLLTYLLVSDDNCLSLSRVTLPLSLLIFQSFFSLETIKDIAPERFFGWE